MTEARLAQEGRMRHLIARRSPTERLRMCSRMFSTARALTLAGIASRSGAPDKADQRRGIFLRFYGNDFTEPQRRAILEGIAASHEAS